MNETAWQYDLETCLGEEIDKYPYLQKGYIRKEIIFDADDFKKLIKAVGKDEYFVKISDYTTITKPTLETVRIDKDIQFLSKYNIPYCCLLIATQTLRQFLKIIKDDVIKITFFMCGNYSSNFFINNQRINGLLFSVYPR